MAAGDDVLETSRLVLEPLRRSHAGEMFGMLSDERLYRFIPHDPPPSQAIVEARFVRLETRASPKGDQVWWNWALRSKASRQIVGHVEATVRRDGSVLLAYEIGVPWWRRGFATEACSRVIEALFEDPAITRLVAEVDTRNAASIKLLTRLGFRLDSTRKDADFFKGETSDEHTFVLER